MSKIGTYNLSEIEKRDDMIQELVEALSGLTRQCDLLNPSIWDDKEFSDAHEKARKAITKATGGQS